MKWALKAIFLTHYTINCFNVPAIIIDIEAWGQFAECKESQIDIVCRICLMWMNLEIISSISSRITSEWAVRPGNIETSHQDQSQVRGQCRVSRPCHTVPMMLTMIPGHYRGRQWWHVTSDLCGDNGVRIITTFARIMVIKYGNLGFHAEDTMNTLNISLFC